MILEVGRADGQFSGHTWLMSVEFVAETGTWWCLFFLEADRSQGGPQETEAKRLYRLFPESDKTTHSCPTGGPGVPEVSGVGRGSTPQST